MTKPERFARARWWGAGAGIVLAITDTLTVDALGIRFELNGHDAWPLVAAWFGCSFALLGYLVGYAAEARRRDRHATALIQAQLEALNTGRARLVQSEKLAALGQLATAIAHEVRNPLAVIRSAAQGLGETVPVDDAAAARACDFIVAEIDRLASVVSSLLDFARPLHLEARAVSVRDLFDRAALLAAGELAAKGARLARDESPALPAVLALPGAEELDALDDDLVLGPLLAGLLVVPLVELQPPLDEQGVALAAVLHDQVDEVPLRLRPVERLAVDVQRVRVALPLTGLGVLAAAAEV